MLSTATLHPAPKRRRHDRFIVSILKKKKKNVEERCGETAVVLEGRHLTVFPVRYSGNYTQACVKAAALPLLQFYASIFHTVLCCLLPLFMNDFIDKLFVACLTCTGVLNKMYFFIFIFIFY